MREEYDSDPGDEMTTPLPTKVRAKEDVLVESWLIEQYSRVGFTIHEAMTAVEQKLDWHRVVDLADAGCSPDLVLRILI